MISDEDFYGGRTVAIRKIFIYLFIFCNFFFI